MKLQKVYPYHLTIKIYCKLDYKFGYAEQSKFSYTFTNLYAYKEMIDSDGSFHTQKKKNLSNTWILTEVQSPIKAQIS